MYQVSVCPCPVFLFCFQMRTLDWPWPFLCQGQICFLILLYGWQVIEHWVLMYFQVCSLSTQVSDTGPMVLWLYQYDVVPCLMKALPPVLLFWLYVECHRSTLFAFNDANSTLLKIFKGTLKVYPQTIVHRLPSLLAIYFRSTKTQNFQFFCSSLKEDLFWSFEISDNILRNQK